MSAAPPEDDGRDRAASTELPGTPSEGVPARDAATPPPAESGAAPPPGDGPDTDPPPRPSPADAYVPPDLPWEPDVDEVPPGDDGTMSLVGHLEELRSRIMVCLAVLVVGALAAYAVSDKLLRVLTSAAPGHRFVFLSPTEAFFTHLSVSFYTGLLVSAPVVVTQLWQFLRPGLTERERRATRGLFPVVTFFFFSGAAFAFFVILPLGLEFLLGFATSELQPMLSIQSFTSFVLTFLLVFGLSFELPVVLFVAARLGLVSTKDLAEARPYFIVGLVTVAALLTPPDVATQLLLAFPVWLLYEGTILLLRFWE